MPLTHVCVWDSEIGYRRVTVDEANELYPYEVPSSRGHFVCELCAQNVGFSKARVDTGTRYFFHSSAAQNKDCEDRQIQLSNAASQRLSSLSSHTMPFRIAVNGSTFTLQLGFFYPPDHKAHCDKIKIANDTHQTYEYSFERIERIGTTYLNVGTVPSRIYGIDYVNANAELKKYWSNKVIGVSATGSLFDGRTGHILLPGAKAFSTNSYYLLQKRQLTITPKDLQIQEISRVRSTDYSIWYLYKIHVKQFSARAAKFFLSYSIFLTEKPTKFYPIWPVYIEDPLFIYHNSNNFYFYLCGDDAELKSYPATSNALDTHDGKLYKLYTREREQLISLGKAGALGFSYLIKQPLSKKAAQPKLTIKDFSGAELIEDSYTKLPKSKYISVSCQYDGKAIVRRGQKIEHIYRISSEQDLLIDGLSLGTEICFYHGCDCIRTICFEQPQIDTSTTELDRVMIAKLQTCTGLTVSIPHSFGSLVRKYESYPQTKKWLYTTLRQGVISRKALRILISDIPNKHRRDIND
ncbi:MAG: hypothetical protein IJF02_01115 [Oscillospiraceae bacterium]|nr:hypothetical protein [Oscillospiraceae bacterium]